MHQVYKLYMRSRFIYQGIYIYTSYRHIRSVFLYLLVFFLSRFIMFFMPRSLWPQGRWVLYTRVCLTMKKHNQNQRWTPEHHVLENHGSSRVGSNLASQVGSGRVWVILPDPCELEHLPTRPDPTREFSRTSSPDTRVGPWPGKSAVFPDVYTTYSVLNNTAGCPVPRTW